MVAAIFVAALLLWLGKPFAHEREIIALMLLPLPVALIVVGALYLRLLRELDRRDRAQDIQNRLNRALRLLSACNMTLIRAEDETKLLDDICRLIVDTGGYKMAWVGYADDDPQKKVRPVSQWGFGNGYLSKVFISWDDNPSGHGPTGSAIRTGETHVNQNVQTNPAMQPWREQALKLGYQSSIGLPLSDGERVFGALTIYSSHPDAFFPDEENLLKEMSCDLAFGITTIRNRLVCGIAQERLAFLDAHDPLTHLPNRLLARDRFAQAMNEAARNHSLVGIMFLDVDNFRNLNSSLGPDLCDKLLVRAAERLQECMPGGTTISRQSGDEFIVQLTDIGDADRLGILAERIVTEFAEPMAIDLVTANLSFSIGISIAPDNGGDFDDLVKCAHTAMREAKASGRNTYRFFTTSMNVDVTRNMHLRHRMPAALKNDEFLLHYQPQIDIASGRTIGVEALVRWRHPEEGMIPPAQFIPLAEDSGFIIPLGEWVLNQACHQVKSWLDAGFPPMVVAVNLSSLQFRRGNTAETVTRALAASGLPAHYLELELTESILLQDTQGALGTVQGLRDMGLKLSIDDFGTGYSNLGYLKRLPLDKLKIDQSFVRNLPHDPNDAAIVRAVIEMGHALRLDVIAEGVETEEQFRELQAYGCDQIQGYWLSRPLPPDQLAQFLRQRGAVPV